MVSLWGYHGDSMPEQHEHMLQQQHQQQQQQMHLLLQQQHQQQQQLLQVLTDLKQILHKINEKLS